MAQGCGNPPPQARTAHPDHAKHAPHTGEAQGPRAGHTGSQPPSWAGQPPSATRVRTRRREQSSGAGHGQASRRRGQATWADHGQTSRRRGQATWADHPPQATRKPPAAGHPRRRPRAGHPAAGRPRRRPPASHPPQAARAAGHPQATRAAGHPQATRRRPPASQATGRPPRRRPPAPQATRKPPAPQATRKPPAAGRPRRRPPARGGPTIHDGFTSRTDASYIVGPPLAGGLPVACAAGPISYIVGPPLAGGLQRWLAWCAAAGLVRGGWPGARWLACSWPVRLACL